MHIISGGDSGGAKTHVFALLDALKKYADIKMICLTPGVFYQEILERDIDTELLEQKTRFDLSVVNEIVNILSKDKYDLIHVHGARANFVATILKGRVSLPVVTTVHSDYNLDFTESLYKKYVFTGINKLALRTMDYYIAVSENFKKMLIGRGFRPNRIFTVYNGMDYSRETPFVSKEEFAKKYNIELSDDLCYVGIIGRFDKVKGHEVFIKGAAEALKKNDKLRFLLAGEGPDQEMLQNLCKKFGIEDKVYFLGFVKDVFSFINFIDINTLTSLSESFPYVLLEGAKFKKPTISSNVGGISDLIEDSVNGMLFESGAYKGFAECIVTLAEDKKRASEYGEALFMRATENFSNDNLAKTHMDIYNSILKDYYDKKRYDFILSGYYGYKNNGDEALLTAIMNNLRSRKKDVRIAVLSYRPKDTKEEFLVDSVSRFNIFRIIGCMRKAKVFLSGGGTLIHDATSSHSLYYYLFTIRLAKLMGLKLMFYANGYGPIKPKNIKAAVRGTELADCITLRDTLSLEEMRNKGVKNENISVTADPALTLNKVNDYITEKILKNEGIPCAGKYIGISVRKWNSAEEGFADKIAKLADYLSEKYGTRTLFIPFKISDDYALSKEIADKMKSESYVIKESYESSVLMGIISKCEMLIGMRLHSLVYASNVSVPVIGLVYDPKIKGFLEYIDQKYFADVSCLDFDYLKGTSEYIMENRAVVTEGINKDMDRLRKLAYENADKAIKLLESKG